MVRNERSGGHRYGVHRVLDTKRCLPQAAEKLDNSLPIYSNEILIRIVRLNIDAASFVQMEKETNHDADKIADIVMNNTRTRGKQQNRETGSGGMLIGKVEQVGSRYKGPLKVKEGDAVATLVSLTLTPLHLERITKVHLSTHQIEADGHAILFESSIAAPLPKDLNESVAMAVYDVAGAPATAAHLAKRGQTVVVIGAGGKAGLLTCLAVKNKISAGKLIGIEPSMRAAAELKSLKLCHQVLEVDATDPIAVFDAVEKATKGKLADLVINVAPVPDTENSALLVAKPKGRVLFYSMATAFAKVTLGAEGIGTSAILQFGNGYFPNHAKFAIDLIRKHKGLSELFARRYQS